MRENFTQKREIHALQKKQNCGFIGKFHLASPMLKPVQMKALILFLALAGLLPMAAQAQINYAVSGNTAYVAYSPSAFGNVVISNIYNGYPVTSIDSQAFADCTSLTNIIIPDSITSIGDWAFADCTSLTNVTIPNSVTNIGDGTFQDCSSLTDITVAADNPAYSSANGVLFNYNQTTILEFPRGYAGNYTLPNSVTNIGEYAFSGSVNLSSVIIPNSVKNISEAAFFLCAGLTNVIIGTNITSIGIGVFENCTSLTSIPIPNSVTNIGEVAFQSSGLTSVTIPRSVRSIGESAFTYCTSLTNLTFLGNAPVLTSGIFYENAATATVYYYYGTSGWGTTYGGLPAVMLGAPAPQIGCGGSVGVQSGNFSFTIAGVTNQTVVVEASTNLVDWQPVWSNTLSGTSTTFTDSQWTNYPARYYRAR